jgi:hypothetical protein
MKEIDLSKLAELVAEGPAGQDKIKRQAKAINELQEALMLMVKRVRPYEVPVKTKDNTIKFPLSADRRAQVILQGVCRGGGSPRPSRWRCHRRMARLQGPGV